MLDSTQVSDLADYVLSPHPASENNSVATPVTPVSAESSGNTKSKKNLVSSQTGPAADMIGNVSHGALLFSHDCESCHGTNGNGGIPNPGSSSGKVPRLNPISKNLYSKNPLTFAENIDRIIQHGSVPPGPDPQLQMLNFGDSHTLTQQEIANIEAYILSLNDVNRASIQVTSFNPLEYIKIIAGVFFVIIIILGIVGYRKLNIKYNN
jgi:mono/diheme cytochrome c family protein